MKGYYIVCCKSVEESVKVQEFLFSIGVYWSTRGKTILKDSDANWLRISETEIQACGDSNKYLSNYYDHVNISDYTFITVDKLMRKIKLKKLDSLYESR